MMTDVTVLFYITTVILVSLMRVKQTWKGPFRLNWEYFNRLSPFMTQEVQEIIYGQSNTEMFSDVMTCRLVTSCRNFSAAWRLHLQVDQSCMIHSPWLQRSYQTTVPVTNQHVLTSQRTWNVVTTAVKTLYIACVPSNTGSPVCAVR